jgi:dihydrofolate synthase/folylpolyglutamate synthase
VLADFIARTWRDRPLDLLIGMMATKDSQGFLDPLAPLVRQFRAVAIPGEASALPADRLAAIATAAGLAGGPVANVADGLAELAGGPGPARVLICGSLYLAGAVLADNGSILTA